MPPLKRMECFKLLFDHLALIEHQFLSGIRDSRKAGSPRGMMRGVGGGRKSIHQSWLAKGLGLWLLCWGVKGVQKEIPSEEASTFQIGSVAFPPGQCTTTPSLSQTIWPRWASRQFLTIHIVQTLPPATFGYSLSSEAVVLRQLRRWKRLWRRSLTRPHKRTFIGRSRSCWNGTTSALQPEEITSKSFMCVLLIKVPIRKKVWKLFNDSRMNISQNMFTHTHTPRYMVIYFLLAFLMVSLYPGLNKLTRELLPSGLNHTDLLSSEHLKNKYHTQTI